MLSHPQPMTNAERQRRFCERNPGYHARRKATRRASQQAAVEQFLRQLQADHAEQTAAAERGPLLLAAPVGPIVLPALDGAWRVREAVCVKR